MAPGEPAEKKNTTHIFMADFWEQSNRNFPIRLFLCLTLEAFIDQTPVPTNSFSKQLRQGEEYWLIATN